MSSHLTSIKILGHRNGVHEVRFYGTKTIGFVRLDKRMPKLSAPGAECKIDERLVVTKQRDAAMFARLQKQFEKI